MNFVHPTYDALVVPARARLQTDRRLGALMDPNISPVQLHWYLMQWSAWGVQMTAPVEGWIRRAGEACHARGYTDLGRALVMHARHEAGHDQLFLNDLEYLVQAWNASGRAPVTTAQFLNKPATASMGRYVALHEEIIASDHPFAQIAIEFEVEGMSTTLGPRFVEQCLRVLGPEAANGLSFLQEHVAIDVGHTAFNQRQMSRFLDVHPDAATTLAITGATALQTYIEFLGDCLDAAVADGPRSDAQTDAVL